MKVKTLHKFLSELIKEGHAHKPVCINKDTFKHTLEGDGVVILPISDLAVEDIRQVDGDGFNIENKDGTEQSKRIVIIMGDYDA